MAYSVLSDEILAKYNVRGRFCKCAVGEPGPAGPAGPMGPAGPRGPRGLPGTSVTNECLAACNCNEDEIRLRQTGVQVKLANHDVMGGFTVNSTGTVFTVPDNGCYLISYQVCFDSDVALISRIMLNNSAVAGLELAPQQPCRCYTCQSIIKLCKGDKLCLMLASTGTVRLQSGTGAFLNVIKLS